MFAGRVLSSVGIHRRGLNSDSEMYSLLQLPIKTSKIYDEELVVLAVSIDDPVFEVTGSDDLIEDFSNRGVRRVQREILTGLYKVSADSNIVHRGNIGLLKQLLYFWYRGNCVPDLNQPSGLGYGKGLYTLVQNVG